ncbi:DUF4148 domain-containing protein [Ottowia sp.]|uniref:DUF4148 domain-containing protein n=1 Tax=Ottowia sp. TaxID=1898956 RepID=UPI003A84A178
MNIKNITLSSIVALAALSGSAFAASQMPESGVGPLFLNPPAVGSTLTRAEVRAEAIQNRPAAGEQTVAQVQGGYSDQSRAEVRAELRQAIEHGYQVPSGVQN